MKPVSNQVRYEVKLNTFRLIPDQISYQVQNQARDQVRNHIWLQVRNPVFHKLLD